MREVRKNKQEVIRIWLEEFKGHRLLNIRVFVMTKDGEEIMTTKGIALQESLGYEVVEAIKAVLDEKQLQQGAAHGGTKRPEQRH